MTASSDPYRGLIRVSCSINSIRDYYQLLTSLLETTKEVMDCAAGSLLLYDPTTDDLIWHVALGDKAGKLKEMARLKMGQGVAGWVAQHRQSALVEDAMKDERFFRGADTTTGFRTRSIICVPLLLENNLVGVLQALNPLHKKFFDKNDLEVFEAYGAMAAIAIEKIRWQEATLQQEKIKQELEIAQEIQSRFLAQSFEEAEAAFQLDFHCQPAFLIGGDFYDVQKTQDDSFAMILGDVTGKGVPAALLMAQLLSQFRYLAPRETDPGNILTLMNDSLSAHSTRGMFATAWCAIVRPEGNRLSCRQASAGHLAPLLSSTDEIKTIDLLSGLPLGIVTNEIFPSSDLILKSGDLLCAYTDGITEGRNSLGEEFGTSRLQETLTDQDARTADVKKKILQSIQHFCEGTQQRDDITFFLCSPR